MNRGMTPETLLLTLAAAGAGCLIALQSPINATMASRIGHPLAGAALSFTVGTVALLVLASVFARGSFDPAAVGKLGPLLLLGGGLLGAVFVTSNIMLTPRIGVAAVVALGIAGQVIASLALDHYGFLGMAVRDLSAGRIFGAVMVVGGALMVRFL